MDRSATVGAPLEMDSIGSRLERPMTTTSTDPMLAADAERRKQVALFRYGLIADLVQLPPHHRGLYKQLTEKAEREYEIPGTLRRHVAAETLRGWLRDYRRGGFDALLPKVRSDLGAAGWRASSTCCASSKTKTRTSRSRCSSRRRARSTPAS